jgi:hypothetical protein
MIRSLKLSSPPPFLWEGLGQNIELIIDYGYMIKLP